MNDEQGQRAAKLIGWIGGPIVVLFLLFGTGIDWSSGPELFLILVGLAVIALVVLVIRALVRLGDKRSPTQVVVPMQSGTPAGWYPDQHDPSLVRWFNGTEWTPATLPRQP